MAKEVEIKATTGKEGTADYKEFVGKVTVYETVAECVAARGEAETLRILNTQIITTARNDLRNPTDPKKQMVTKMLRSLSPEKMDKLIKAAEKLGISLQI